MDDEEVIHLTVGRMLEELGYEVDGVFGGVEALNAYEASLEAGNPYDVVIMDLTIPGGMGGEEAVKKLHEIHAEVPVIVSSGYSNDQVMANYEDYGFHGIVRKPVDMFELADAVQEVLND